MELKKAVLGVQSGVQAILRAVRRFSSDFSALLVVFPRFSPDIGRHCAGPLVRGHRGRLPAAEMLETCWTLIALLNVASTVPTLSGSLRHRLSSRRPPATIRGAFESGQRAEIDRVRYCVILSPHFPIILTRPTSARLMVCEGAECDIVSLTLRSAPSSWLDDECMQNLRINQLIKQKAWTVGLKGCRSLTSSSSTGLITVKGIQGATCRALAEYVPSMCEICARPREPLSKGFSEDQRECYR